MKIEIVLLSILLVVVVRGDDSCITHPSTPNCVNATLPGVDMDINMMCDPKMMPNMAGCTIFKKICSQSQYSSGPYCNHFSILKEMCLDMNMDSCTQYNSMCNSTSVVAQCATKILPIPSYFTMVSLIKSMCAEMSMPQCPSPADVVTSDLLTVYSNLCISMPDMDECKSWAGYCSLVPTWPICTSTPNGDQPPQMRMYFHTGLVDYILLEGWVPRTPLQYAGSFFAIIVIVLLYDALKFLRFYIETRWARDQKVNNSSEMDPLINGDPSAPVLTAKFNWKVDLIRASLQALEVGWGLIVMLVAMTYNVGLFFALIVGAFIGSMIFGRFVPYEPKKQALCH